MTALGISYEVLKRCLSNVHTSFSIIIIYKHKLELFNTCEAAGLCEWPHCIYRVLYGAVILAAVLGAPVRDGTGGASRGRRPSQHSKFFLNTYINI
jgi:hypothetical protein